MIERWSVVALALGYLSILFALAWYADRTVRRRKAGNGRPLIYALSLAVYCTSWTFFGSVGLAASTGYDFIPVYLGPILLFVFGWRLLVRIVRLAKSQNITSVADFLAARYGKSQAVAAIVTVVAVAGTLPYIALQLKAVALSADALLGPRVLPHFHLPTDTALVAALAMGTFAILFGTRHIDATEHQEGLIVAVAAESLVKLAAFLTVGFFVTFSVFGGVGGFIATARATAEIQKIFGQGFNGGTWITVTFLSLVCIVLLPRQFHVTVVENHTENELRRAAWLFPVYLVLINLFVVPIAAAGLMFLPQGYFEADTYVLALPLAKGSEVLTLFAFVGGLSAATAMVIVELSRVGDHGMQWARAAAAAAPPPGRSQGAARGYGPAAAHDSPRRHLCHRAARLSLLPPARQKTRSGLHWSCLLCGDCAICSSVLRWPHLAQCHGARRHRRHRRWLCGLGLRCCYRGSSRPAGCRVPY